jgi:hypothetical protein
MHVWVKIIDMPFGLRNRDVVSYLVHEYVILVECDMSSLIRSDIF